MRVARAPTFGTLRLCVVCACQATDTFMVLIKVLMLDSLRLQVGQALATTQPQVLQFNCLNRGACLNLSNSKPMAAKQSTV